MTREAVIISIKVSRLCERFYSPTPGGLAFLPSHRCDRWYERVGSIPGIFLANCGRCRPTPVACLRRTLRYRTVAAWTTGRSHWMSLCSERSGNRVGSSTNLRPAFVSSSVFQGSKIAHGATYGRGGGSGDGVKTVGSIGGERRGSEGVRSVGIERRTGSREGYVGYRDRLARNSGPRTSRSLGRVTCVTG